METLVARLNALQEHQLELYEADSNDIKDQIDHWNTLRKEYVLHHFARKNSMTRLGLQTVMSLQASQEKAKEAIQMVLLLQSLEKTDYGKEPWTLTETSLEMYYCPPKYCFKKRGTTVQVTFDGDPQNTMHYTSWADIYYETDDGWTKTVGLVDYLGCYYCEAGARVYYVNFDEEAKRFSKNHEWQVRYKSCVFSSPSSVSSTTDSPSRSHIQPECRQLSQQPSLPLDNSPASRGRERGFGDFIDINSNTTNTHRHTGARKGSKDERRQATGRPASREAWGTETRRQGGGRGRGGRRGRGGERGRGRGQRRREEGSREARFEDVCRSRSTTPERYFGGEAAASSSHGPRQAPAFNHTEGPNGAPREEEEERPGDPGPPVLSPQVILGAVHPDAVVAPRRRRHLVPEAACDIPVLIFRGGPNQLKCTRYRWRRNYSDLFSHISKTWSWVDGDLPGNSARLLVAFNTNAARNRFLDIVPIPEGVTFGHGRLSGL